MLRKELWSSRLLSALGAVVLVSLTTTSASATATLRVGTCPGFSANYPTIQSAVDAAHAGDTINVCPGTYNEQVTITKKGLTLIGRLSTANATDRLNTISNPAKDAILQVSPGAVGFNVDAD